MHDCTLECNYPLFQTKIIDGNTCRFYGLVNHKLSFKQEGVISEALFEYSMVYIDPKKGEGMQLSIQSLHSSERRI